MNSYRARLWRRRRVASPWLTPCSSPAEQPCHVQPAGAAPQQPSVLQTHEEWGRFVQFKAAGWRRRRVEEQPWAARCAAAGQSGRSSANGKPSRMGMSTHTVWGLCSNVWWPCHLQANQIKMIPNTLTFLDLLLWLHTGWAAFLVVVMAQFKSKRQPMSSLAGKPLP